ncbi:MAG: FAD:protein FMN transferase [Treponemataceae bacterium]
MKIFIIFLMCFFISCKKNENVQPFKRLTLGTVSVVNVFEKGTEKIYAEINSVLQEIENEMSFNLPDSYISKINENAGKSPVIVSEKTYFVIKTAIEYAEKSNGVFDPTIGPLVQLWDIAGENPRVPEKSEIENLLPLVDFRQVTLNDSEYSVYLEKEGMMLDVGGIAKGFAADELVRLFKKHKISRAIIDLGGNVYAFGSRGKNLPWRIGIKSPVDPRSEPLVLLFVSDRSVVTSGAYERFFEEDNIRYHHILDTKTGYPAQSDAASFTIVNESSFFSDVLSTTAFILGKDAGLAFLENENILGLCITEDTDIFTTKNFSEKWERLPQ